MSQKLARLVVAVEMAAESLDALLSPKHAARLVEPAHRESYGAEKGGANGAR